MRHILTLLLAASLAQAQFPIELMRKPSLSRSALAAGVQTGSVNLFTYSEPLLANMAAKSAAIGQASFTENGLTNGVTFPAANQTDHVYMSPTLIVGKVYTVSAFVIMDDGSAPVVGATVSSGDMSVVIENEVGTNPTVTFVGGSLYRIQAYLTTIAGGVKYCGVVRYNTQTDKAFRVTGFMLNLGPTALPYVATTDLQSIPSINPGTGSIVRGANTGASTDDPAVSLLGWTFDSGDRVSGLPAKGDAWTTINCSNIECYAIDSNGNEYINGVARRNLLRWSEGLDNAAWLKLTNGTGSLPIVTADAGISPSGETTAERIQFALGGGTTTDDYSFFRGPLMTVTSGTSYTCGTWIKNNSSGPYTLLLTAFEVGSIATANVVTSDEWQQFTVTKTALTNSAQCELRLRGGQSPTHTDTADLLVYGFQMNPGDALLAYQKTTDSREWALETVGNYVGLLTGWYRWDRVIGPGEVLNNYRAWQKPRINSVGNTLP